MVKTYIDMGCVTDIAWLKLYIDVDFNIQTVGTVPSL